jgi:hypothetical protein
MGELEVLLGKLIKEALQSIWVGNSLTTQQKVVTTIVVICICVLIFVCVSIFRSIRAKWNTQ